MQTKRETQGAPSVQVAHSYPPVHGSIPDLAVAYANHLEVQVERLRRENIDLSWANANAQVERDRECLCDECRPSAANPLGVTIKDLLDDSKRLCAALEAENTVLKSVAKAAEGDVVKLHEENVALKADVRRMKNTMAKRIVRADRVK